jgi:WD40 repeat protein
LNISQLKPWAEPSSPFGAKNDPKHFLSSRHSAQGSPGSRWSVNGHQLFTGGQEPNVKVWAYDEDRAEKLALLTTLYGKEHIRAIITCPDGTAIYTAGTGPKIKYWPGSSYSVESIRARAQLMVNRSMSDLNQTGRATIRIGTQ